MQVDPMESIPTYILAGGASSRLGSDKARAVLRGVPLIVRVARDLGPIASRLVVVADRSGKYDDLGLETIGDLTPGCGPLGGIQAALHHHGPRGWLLCVSCDRLGVRPEWIASLLRARPEAGGAVAFRSERWEPFPSLLHASLAPLVDAAIENGSTAPWRVFDRCAGVALPLPHDWGTCTDVNTPEALHRLGG